MAPTSKANVILGGAAAAAVKQGIMLKGMTSEDRKLFLGMSAALVKLMGVLVEHNLPTPEGVQEVLDQAKARLHTVPPEIIRPN